MTQTSPGARIDAALVRIETALASRRRDAVDAARRHDALRKEVAAAIAALDKVLGAEGRG